jgi:hypothetical protein
MLLRAHIGRSRVQILERQMARIEKTVLLVSTAFLAVAMALIFVKDAHEVFNHEKSFEVALQFVFVAVLGGAVAFLYNNAEARRNDNQKEIEERHKRRDTRISALEEFHRTLVDVHHRFKKVRRLLRASSFVGMDGQHACERRQFEELMRELEDVQLKAEGLREEVDIRQELFGASRSELKENLSGAEEYVATLLAQFENQFKARRDYAAADLMPLCAALAEFIQQAPPAEASIRKQYFNRIAAARHLLIKRLVDELVTPRGKTGPD